MKFVVPAIVAFTFTLGCAGGASRLQPYKNQAPEQLLAAVDREIYSPVARGLRHVEADVLVDVTGFYPPASRPEEQVWLPVRFTWKQGKASFAAGSWPAGAEPLRQQVLALLDGKEEDIIQAPFAERFAGFTLAVQKSGDTLVLVARKGGESPQRWQLTIDENLRVPAMQVSVDSRNVNSEITYGPQRPALIHRIDSSYFHGKQATMVQVEYSYGKAGRYVLPDELVYRTMIGRNEYPPLTLRIRNVKAE